MASENIMIGHGGDIGIQKSPFQLVYGEKSFGPRSTGFGVYVVPVAIRGSEIG